MEHIEMANAIIIQTVRFVVISSLLLVVANEKFTDDCHESVGLSGQASEPSGHLQLICTTPLEIKMPAYLEQATRLSRKIRGFPSPPSDGFGAFRSMTKLSLSVLYGLLIRHVKGAFIDVWAGLASGMNPLAI